MDREYLKKESDPRTGLTIYSERVYSCGIPYYFMVSRVLRVYDDVQCFCAAVDLDIGFTLIYLQ